MVDQVSAADADAKADVTGPDATQIKWLSVIEQHDKAFRDWKKRAHKLWRIYSEERRQNRADAGVTDRKMSLFWSNVSTLQPAVYANTPKPNVSRRFKDDDPVARQAAEMVERCLIACGDEGDIDRTLRMCRNDFLVVGRGTAWVRYEAETEAMSDDEGNPLNERGEPLGEDDAPAERIAGEHLEFDYVHWDDFGHSVARTWEEVTAVWRRVYMSRADGEKRFGKENFRTVQLDHRVSEADGEEMEDTKQSELNKATVYEIWDKISNKVYFIAKGARAPLEVVEPYLDLKDFFPCPRPLFGTVTTNSLIPTPEYVFYQDQCEEIDDLTQRIASLQDALKLVGFYPGGPDGEAAPQIEKAAQAGFENQLIAVPNWSSFVEGGKGGAPIVWWPVEQVAKTITACIELRKQLIEDVYQITGISDIMRGEGEKGTTATEQNLKSQWGSIRIRDRQHAIAVFSRDIFRIAAEIIADKFQPDTIMAMSNTNLPTAAEIEQQVMAAQMQALQQRAMQAQAQPQIPQAGGGMAA